MNKPFNKPESSKISPNITTQNKVNVTTKPTIISKENFKNQTKPLKSNFKGNPLMFIGF